MSRLGKAKTKMIERAASGITPSETPIGQSFADVFVTLEGRQSAVLNRALEAAGADVRAGQDPHARRDRLLSLADAVAGRDIAGWWWEDVAPDVLDNPEQAREYVGLGADEWHDQLRRWYQSYVDAGVVDVPLEDVADRGRIAQVADRHIQETYGITLQEFVATVINWSGARAGRELVTSPIHQHNQLIDLLADELEARNERIAELEQRLDDVDVDE